MRHFCNIRHNRVACNILPQCKGKLRGVLLKGIAFQQRPHINRLRFLIWHLNADCRLAGNGRFNTNPARRQIQRDIIRQIHNLADLYALARRKLIARHSRAPADLDYLCIHAKAFQRGFQLSCIFKQFRTVAAVTRLRVFSQQRNRRKDIRPFLLDRCRLLPWLMYICRRLRVLRLCRFFGFLRFLCLRF